MPQQVTKMIEQTVDIELERLRAKARLEIGEKEELIPKYLQDLKDALKEDPLLTVPNDNDFLIRFLRSRKYNVERAAKMVKKFFLLRSSVNDMIDLLKPTQHVHIYNTEAASFLKRRDGKGRQILLLRACQWDPNKNTFDDVISSVFLLLDEALCSLDTQYNGVVLIVDFKGFGFSHARQIGPRRLQAVASLLQDSYPARFKEIHLIHHPTIFNMVDSIIKPFLKEKIRKRINFHAHDVSSLHKFVGTEYLPQVMGGQIDNDEYSDTELIKRLLKKDDYYNELKTFGYQRKLIIHNNIVNTTGIYRRMM